MSIETTQSSDQEPAEPGNGTAAEAVVDAKMAFLRTQIDRRISSFDRRRKRNRRNALWIKILVSTFGVAVTILLGLDVGTGKGLVGNIALVLSGMITLFSVLEGFFDYRMLWVRYTVTTNQLRTLRSRLEYARADGAGTLLEEQLDQLFEEYLTTIDETNQVWTELRKQESSEPLV